MGTMQGLHEYSWGVWSYIRLFELFCVLSRRSVLQYRHKQQVGRVIPSALIMYLYER